MGDGEHPVVQGWGMESTRWYRGGGGRAPGGTGVRELGEGGERPGELARRLVPLQLLQTA